MQQIPKGSEAVGCSLLGSRRRIEVGPCRRDEGLGSVGQDQQQLESAVAVHPPQYVQGLTFKGVAPPNDLYCRREPLEVGSVSPFLSIACTTWATPIGAATHVLDSLARDGTWLIVEPLANDRVEDNLNPVGRVFYNASTLICTPASLSQEGGLGLGAQAGEGRLRDVVLEGGFTRFHRATETPFNLVFEARP